MTEIAALIADMVRAGVDPDLIGRTADALAQREVMPTIIDEAAERRRAKDRERKRLRNSAESAEIPEALSSLEVSPQTPFPKPTNPSPLSPLKGPPFPSDFETWYRTYPHKVQRGAAERAFPKARQIASLEELLAGVERYVASKPADRPWQNPATWLNGKGWLDTPAPVARAGPEPRRTVHSAAEKLLREMELADAIPASEIEGNHPPPRQLAYVRQ
jgi:hypothetical protein